MNEGVGLFESALGWLRDHYDEFLFRREDDVVTVLWAKMVKTAREKSLPVVVDFEQNFKVASGRLQCDFVILGDDANPLLCVEVRTGTYAPRYRASCVETRSARTLAAWSLV